MYALTSVPYRQQTFMGFGAAGALFNGATVWSDWLLGAQGNNAAGMRASDAIRLALDAAGYGPFQMGASWGTAADKAGMGKFVNDKGIPPSPNGSWWPTQAALLKLQEVSPIGVAHAGMSGTTIGLLLGAAVVLGGLALMSKKKGSGGSYSTGMTRYGYTANGTKISLGPGSLREGLVIRRKGTRRKEVVGPRSKKKWWTRMVTPADGKGAGRYLTTYYILHNYYLDSSDQ